MLVILLLGAFTVFLYIYVIKPMNYWKNKNVVHKKPLPLFGNMLPLVLKQYNNTKLLRNIYEEFPNERYVGMCFFRRPALLIRDPDLIKRIMVKEFDTFSDHLDLVPRGVDPLWSKNLFAMEGGEEWHELRSTLSPSFTSSKMKAMFVLMKECSRQFTNHFLKQGESIEVDLKDTFARFATDVIATTAFGVTCDSLSDQNNEFYLMAQDVSNFRGVKGIVFLLNFLSPTLARYIKSPMYSKKVGGFFQNIVKDSMKLRREKGIVRVDMLHLLMEAQKDSFKYDEASDIPEAGFAAVEESNIGRTQRKRKIEVTDEVITAQVLIFFFAGFDTVSTTMSFIVYELAVHPEIQEKLREEVDRTLSNSNGEWTYENLMGMKYLDMVVSETLRKWPPNNMLDRVSVKPFTLEPERPHEPHIHLETGSAILFPVECLHRDSKYYPNPDKFDPERFSDENKHNILPYTYFPFGLGPRNCIGSRFALLEAKLIVAEIISKFEVVPTKKTQIPLVLGKSTITQIPDEGIWMGLKRRTS